MRVLLINNHCISDPTAGVTQSLRTIMEWLADAGHACHILTTARFESAVTFTLDEHLRAQGVNAAAGESRLDTRVRDVPVTLLRTHHNDERRPNAREARRYLARVDALFDRFEPSLLIACNGHPMIFEALARARRRGITTAYAVRGFGYYDMSYFADVDHAFTCSRFLADHYSDRIGLVSTPIEPPLDWSSVVAPEESRAFATFVESVAAQGSVSLRAWPTCSAPAARTFPSSSSSRDRAVER